MTEISFQKQKQTRSTFIVTADRNKSNASTSAGPLNLNLPTERCVLFWAGPSAAPSHVGCDSWCSCNGGLVTTAGCQIFSGKKQMCSLSVCLILNGVLLAQKQRGCHCASSLDVLNFPWFVPLSCAYTQCCHANVIIIILCMCVCVWWEGVKMLTLSTRCLPRWRSLCNVNGVFKGAHVTRRLKVALETDIAARDGPCLTDLPKNPPHLLLFAQKSGTKCSPRVMICIRKMLQNEMAAFSLML